MTHQAELEQVLLGSILNSPDLIDSHFLERHITSDFFTLSENKWLYSMFLNMHFQKLEINPMSSVQFAVANQMLDQIGGPVHIAELEGDSSAGNIDFYISELQGSFTKRQVADILLSAKDDFEGKEIVTAEDVTKLIESLSVYTELENTTQYQTMQNLYDLLQETTDDLRKNKNPGILTGFNTFDSATNGFQKGELNILAARPSIGKTSLALSMAMNTSLNHSTAFISLETPAKTIAQKIGSMLNDVPVFQLRNGYISDSDYTKIFSNESLFTEKSFILVDKSNLNISELKGILRHLKIVFGIDLVFLDYIGLVDAGDSRMPVYEKQAIVSKSLKSYARELDISICALCQVARAQEKNEKPPVLSDLRGSGSIEQDADVVMFIHGSRYLPEGQKQTDRQFIIAKNRNGECKTGLITFNAPLARYEPKAAEEIPE